MRDRAEIKLWIARYPWAHMQRSACTLASTRCSIDGALNTHAQPRATLLELLELVVELHAHTKAHTHTHTSRAVCKTVELARRSIHSTA